MSFCQIISCSCTAYHNIIFNSILPTATEVSCFELRLSLNFLKSAGTFLSPWRLWSVSLITCQHRRRRPLNLFKQLWGKVVFFTGEVSGEDKYCNHSSVSVIPKDFMIESCTFELWMLPTEVPQKRDPVCVSSSLVVASQRLKALSCAFQWTHLEWREQTAGQEAAGRHRQ